MFIEDKKISYQEPSTRKKTKDQNQKLTLKNNYTNATF